MIRDALRIELSSRDRNFQKCSLYFFSLGLGLLCTFSSFSSSAESDSTPLKWGDYRIRLGLSQTNFDDGMKYYEQLYGSASSAPALDVDILFWRKWVGLGMRLGTGYYSDSGFAADPHTITKKDPPNSEIIPDKNSPTSLSFFPLKWAAFMEFPIWNKYITGDTWAGVEQLYWQEVRRPLSEGESTADSESSGSGSSGSSTSTTSSSSEGLQTNKGKQLSYIFGFSMNFNLTGLDTASVASMEKSLGISAVYLSPYFETIRITSKKGLSLGRTHVGLGFTFETL